MKATELRSGNFVQGNNFAVPRLGISSDGVTQITAVGIAYIEEGSITVEPIPLTEEWLLKFGFEKDNSRYNWIHRNPLGTGICINAFANEVGFWFMTARIHSMHQLQNLYFALTGEELNL